MTPLFGPGWGNYAIRGIVETPLPPAVALTPQTAGWALLLAGILLAIAYGAWQRRKRWLRERYRRDALAALRSLRERHEGGDVRALRELAPLLRATALAAAADRRLAPLRGEEWAKQLHAMAPGVDRIDVTVLDALAYAPGTPEPDQVALLFDRVGAWIEGHELHA